MSTYYTFSIHRTTDPYTLVVMKHEAVATETTDVKADDADGLQALRKELHERYGADVREN
jgi:hypothetical protein